RAAAAPPRMRGSGVAGERALRGPPPGSSVRRLALRPVAQCLAGIDRDLDAAVLLPAFLGIVARHRLVLAASERLDASIDAALVEVAARRTGAALRQILVVPGRADRVGVAHDHEIGVW